MMNIERNMTLYRQDGAVTILISLVMLFLVTLVVLTTSKTVLMEQKIASNSLRSEQSFEAAETGIQQALNYIGNDPSWDYLEELIAGDNFNIFETSSPADTTPDVNTGTLPDGSSYALTISSIDLTGDTKFIGIVSTGNSDDGIASRTVSRLIKFIDPLPFPLGNPLLTGGGATVTGSANVWNPEGHSTIWSGGSINVGSNTHIADPTDSDYPDCMETPMTCSTITSSTGTLTGLDVIEEDSSLASLTNAEFFKNFFGMSKAEYKNTQVTLEVNSANINNEWDAATPGANHAENQVIWVDATAAEASIAGGGVVGCEDSTTTNNAYGENTCPDAKRTPSIMIVDGDLRLTGNFDHYGILFVTGEIFAAGSARIEGALVIGGGSGNTGSMDVWFNSEMVKGAGEGNNWGGSDGGWRDF
jgi:hypothetical protein